MLQVRNVLTFILLMVIADGSLFAQEINEVKIPEKKDVIDIPYEKFVLDNGLTLVVHEDNKAPIVAVNIWYHVGSKNEKIGKTGFAHLFEHLMFNGSENNDDDYFQVMERIGSTDLNGTTNEDRTNYFQNVPKNQLDAALWMESDRMGHLLGAIDQEKLDEQRGVVQNEKRQGENQPYGQAYNIISENTWPEGHPYSWSVIGSMDDLNAASLEDVNEWFETYYGAANAVVVIAGDIDPQTAKAKVEKYFGDIQSGPPIAKHDAWIAKRKGTHRMTMEDRVPQSRIYKVWNVPEEGTQARYDLDLVTDILSSGKNSRLYKRLVYEDQIASNASAFISPQEIASQVIIMATANPGVELSKVEKAVDEELARFIANGPTEDEMVRIRSQFVSGFIRGVERIGGFGGKSDVLAANEVYLGSPDAFKRQIDRVQSVTATDLQMVAREWLSDGQFILEIHPFPEYTASTEKADRTSIPEGGAEPTVEFPTLQRATLSNGIEVVLAERHSTPLVEVDMLFDAGYSADKGGKAGLASMVMNMMDEGTDNLNSLEISEQESLLGANVSTGSDLDISFVGLSALTENLDASMDLWKDVILNANFPQNELNRLKQERKAQIQREKSSPVQMALRVYPKLIYGDDHSYGIEFTGSGTEQSVESISRSDLVKFTTTWFKPNNATVVAAGDITMEQLLEKLEGRFKDWKKGNVPTKKINTVQRTPETVYIMDKPGAQQSIIFAGHVAPPKSDKNDLAISTMNTVVGGSFTSRINMNLREDKGWSYGSQSLILDARGQRPFLVYAPVQTDKTKESMVEIKKELNGVLTEKPIDSAELNKAVASLTLSLPGQWETLNSLNGSVWEIVEYGLDDNYYKTYSNEVRALSVDDLNNAAEYLIHPENLVWVVVGDREKIEAGIRELGFSDIKLLDADGNVLSD